MLNYHHQTRCSWADHWQLYCQVVVNEDKTSRKEDQPSLYTGRGSQNYHHQKKTWCPGKIISKCNEPRSYVVETPNGTRMRRNRAHLRELVASPAKTVRFSEEPARPKRFSDEPARPTWFSDQPARPTRFNDQPARPTRFSDEPARPTWFSDQPARPTRFSDEPARPTWFSDQPARPTRFNDQPARPTRFSDQPPRPTRFTINHHARRGSAINHQKDRYCYIFSGFVICVSNIFHKLEYWVDSRMFLSKTILMSV